MWGGILASKKIKPRSGTHKNTLLHRSVEMALVYMYWRINLLAVKNVRSLGGNVVLSDPPRLLAWPTPNAPQQQCIHGMWGGIQASKKRKTAKQQPVNLLTSENRKEN